MFGEAGGERWMCIGLYARLVLRLFFGHLRTQTLRRFALSVTESLQISSSTSKYVYSISDGRDPHSIKCIIYTTGHVVFSFYLRDFTTRHSVVALKCMICQLMVVYL